MMDAKLNTNHCTAKMKRPILLTLLFAAPIMAADGPDAIVGCVGDVQVNAGEVRASVAALGEREGAGFTFAL
jgi:hypothetical protein